MPGRPRRDRGPPRAVRSTGQRVGVVPPLGDREADPLARRAETVAQARSQPRIGAEGEGLGEDADELGDGAAGRLDALEQGALPSGAVSSS